MKLHLPVRLFRYVFSCFSLAAVFSLSSGSVTAADTLVLNSESVLSIDYADVSSIFDLSGGILQLSGDTLLNLSNCGEGDGKTYTLLTGVSALRDAEGNAIVLDSSNNFISLYFDTTRPGVGFWVNSTLQLTSDGSLQLVRHAESIKDAVAITTRQIGSVNYHYYTGVEAYNCSSDNHGGAIYGKINSTITLSDNGRVEFSGNKADLISSASGGAIYGGYDSTIELSGNGSVTFSGNTASYEGGAIYGDSNSTITLSGNGSVTFSGNTASYEGGAIDGWTVELSRNGSVTFSDNSGGAIEGNTIELSGNGSVTFSGNTAFYYGGAIYGSTVELSRNGSVTFSGNTASDDGGAIHVIAEGTIRLSGNGSVEFIENMTSSSEYNYNEAYCYAYGGGIDGGTVELCDNESVEFSGNIAFSYSDAGYGSRSDAYANSYGGAINGGAVTLSRNRSVNFAENAAYASANFIDHVNTCAHGGAINADFTEISFNKRVAFLSNKVQDAPYETYENIGDEYWFGEYKGGAICAIETSISSNEEVIFQDNVAGLTTNWSRATGGAISGSYVRLTDNDILQFVGNSALSYGYTVGTMDYFGPPLTEGRGGAIYGDSEITLSDNGAVVFCGNKVSAYYIANADSCSAYGGAIYGTGILSICNNDSVLFEKNVEIGRDKFRLRSIYVGGSRDVISLSAAAGKSIEFRDAVYIGSGSTVELNADYTDAEDVVHKQDGDIRFTGAYVEKHLNELLVDAGAGRVATGEEIRLSRTTEVQAMTNLYGGRLIIEDGAIYKGYGITAMDGSNATVRVKDATLNHTGYDLTFNDGTTLELEGTSNIIGNMKMLEGSTVRLKNATVSGNAIPSAFESKRTLEIVGFNSIIGDVQMLEGSTLRVVLDDAAAPASVLILNGSLALKTGSMLQMEVEDGRVTLQGGGMLLREGSADFSAFSLGKNWSGTVKLENITTDTNLNFGQIGQSGSTIELENVMGYTGVNGGTVAADLQLNRSTAADGTAQAALVISNGYSHKTNADHVMTTFSGTVSGYGKMVYEKTLSNQYTGFAFSGDVSGWTGAFEMNGGKTFNLVFNGKATEINADIRDISGNGTLNLRLGANAAMSVNGTVDADSIIVTNNHAVSFSNTVETGSLSAAGSSLSFDAAAVVSGDMSAAALTLGESGSLSVGGTLSTGLITLQYLTLTAPALTVGQFDAGDTIFSLSRENLDSLNLAHGESVVIARAGNDISQDFRAWVAEGSTSIDAVVYRYDLSVSGADVMVSKDYANWGTRVWYGSEWVGKESWKDYMAAGYDAVNGVETVNLSGELIEAENLIIAPGDSSAVTELSNGEMLADYTEVADGKLRIAEDTVLETVELAAEDRDIELQGELIVTDGQIGTLSGTTGELTIDGELSVDSNVTLGSLDNAGSLDIGKHKLNVAGALTNGGNVIAGEVVVHNRTRNFAEFDTLVADRVTVTNTSTSASYTDNISVGDGSAIGELTAEKLEVRGGTVTLGRTDAATEQTLLALDLQDDAALVLNQQTALSVTDELTATEGAELRLKQQASVSYGDTSIRNRGAAAQVVVNAYELANDSIQELSHAHVEVSGSGDTTIDYKLTDSSVENTGSGKLVVTHAENTLSGVFAAGGDITVMNQALALNLQELVVGEGVNFSAYQGETELPEQEAVVSVSQSVSFGAQAHINADLKLQSGVRVEMNGPVSMGSDLYLFSGMTLGGTLLENIQRAEQGQAVVLFSGIDTLYLCGEEQTDAITLSHGVSASEYFTNLISSQERSYYLVYDNETPGQGVLSIAVSGLAVPEPTSSTLSLLALAALAARRRRK